MESQASQSPTGSLPMKETDTQFTGQGPESRPLPAAPVSDVAQASQQPADSSQEITAITGNSNILNNITNVYINNKSSKKKKKNKKDKKKKSKEVAQASQQDKKKKSKEVAQASQQDKKKKSKAQGGKRGGKRPSFTSEELKKKQKKRSILCYPMCATPSGKALIINNEYFLDKRLKRRDGTNKDCEDIEQVFEDLDFIIVKKQNLELDEMRQAFLDIQKEDHSSFDCFVAVIMSHGMMNGICGKDSDIDKPESVLNVQKICEIMDKCPTLTGKPKLIFTQACRGESILASETSQVDSPDHGKNDVLTQSDFLISYSTIEAHASIRHPIDGTWYINSLCEVLRKHAKTEDLNSMLTMLNKKVGEIEGFTAVEGIPDSTKVKQTAEFTSRLTKKLFFKPVKRTQQNRNGASTSEENTNEGQSGRKRSSSRMGFEESEAKKKLMKPSSTPYNQSGLQPLAPSNRDNQNGGVSVAPRVPRSKLSTVLLHQRLDKGKSLHLYIQEVEYECEKRGEKLLRGKFIVMDQSDWAYLVVFGKAKKSLLKKNKSILVRHILSVAENIIKCNGTDVEALQSPFSVPPTVIQKMRQEEKFSLLTSISRNTYKKIRVVIDQVGKIEMLRGENGKPYPRRHLRVSDIKPSGKLGKKHDLLLYNKAARSKLCKRGETIIVSNVGKAENGQFRTFRECSVRKYEV